MVTDRSKNFFILMKGGKAVNLDQFNLKLEQRDHKLQKRAKLRRMNRYDAEPKVRKILNRMNVKREWLESKDEE